MNVVIAVVMVVWALATVARLTTRHRSYPPVSAADEWIQAVNEADHEGAAARLISTCEDDIVRLTFYGPQSVPLDHDALRKLAVAVAHSAEVVVDVDEATDVSIGFGTAMLFIVRSAHLVGADVTVLGHNRPVDRILELYGLDELVVRSTR